MAYKLRSVTGRKSGLAGDKPLARKSSGKAYTLQLATLAVAVLAVYPLAYADGLVREDGLTHSVDHETYEFIEVRYDGTSKTTPTTLDASNLKIAGTPPKPKIGAVFAKGGTVNLNDSTVTTTANEAYGLQAFSAQLGEAATAVSADRVHIHTTGDKAHGAFLYFEQVADRSETNITIDYSSILTEGKQASGLLVGNTSASQSKGVGALTVNNSTITTKGDGAIGLRAERRGDAKLNQSHIVTDNAIGVSVTSGGTVTLEDSSISAGNAAGLVVDGSGSKATLTNTDVNGKGRGILVNNEGFVSLTGGTVQTGTHTSESITVSVEGGASLEADGVTFIAESDGLGTGDLTSVIRATGADTNIDLIGGHVINKNNTSGRGLLAASSAIITTDSVQISTAGTKSNAVHAYSGVKTSPVAPEDSDTPRIELKGGDVATGGDDSYGLLSQNNGSYISAENLTITTSGTDSYGAVAYNGAEILLTDVDVVTGGQGAHGISMGQTSVLQIPVREPVPNVASTITVTGGNILVTGTNSSGVNLQDSGKVDLNGVRVESTAASILSTMSQANQTQNITVGAGSNLTVNNGILLQVNRTEDGMDGTVNLTLKSGSTSKGDIVDLDGLTKGETDTREGKTNFHVETGASWTGMQRGINDTTVGDGGSIVNTGGGSITGNVAGGTNSNLVFTNGASISGGVSAGAGSTASFNGPTTVGGNVTGEGTSFSFSGPTTIGGNVALGSGSALSGGTTNTPITITGDVAVTGGSTLGGNLNVSGALTGTNGILGPGNSTGIQTYGSLGDFTGTYIAEVNASGKSDLIKIATGDADLSTIALRVRQENGNGGYVLNHDYTILQTLTGEVKNTFAGTPSLDDSFANALVKLDPVKYGAKDVKISLVADTAKVAAARPGLSGNQNAVLDGVLSVAGPNSATDAVMFMNSAEERNNALNQLSGEVHGSTQSALHSSGGLLVSTVGNRMRGNVGAGMLAGAPTADASGSAVAGSMPRSAAYPLWAEVVGNWNTLDGDDNAAETKSHTAGIYVGGDTAVGNGWRVGGALGFTDGRIKADSVGSRSDVRSYTATVYGGNQWAAGNGQVNFLAGAGYTRHNIDSRRSINVGGSQTLKADYHANTVQLFTELGYAMPVGQVSTIEPYAGVAWSSQRTKDFTETGGSAALHGKGQTDDVTTLTLGLRGTTLMAVGQHDARLSAGLGWRHASGDVNANRTMSFVQGGGAAFTVAGAPIAKNAAVVDLGAEVDVGKNAAMGLAYSGQFGNGSTDSTGSLYLKVRF